MVDLVLGIAAAVGASTLYSLGIALQALDAKESSHDEHLHPSLVMSLVRRSRWLAGTGMSILGFPLQLVALLLAPLVVVQPALAAGLLVLLFFGERMLGERAGRYEHVAMLAIAIGGLGIGLAAPARTTHEAGRLTITLVLVGLALASMLPYLLHAIARSPAVITMLGAGLGFGWSGVATKLASNDLFHGRIGLAAAWALSTAAASGVGVLSEMSALQSRPAIQVAPVVFVTQTVIPVVLAPLLFGESFAATPLGGVPLAISLALLMTGAALLARSPLLLALMAPQAVREASDSTASPHPASRERSRSSPATEAGEPSASSTSTFPERVAR